MATGKGWGYALRIDTRAPIERIWQALTRSEDLERWCAAGASIQPRRGGLFRAAVDRVTELEAHIDLFEEPRRLRLIYLPSSALPPTDSALVDDFMIDLSKNVTIVRLLGSGVPAAKQWEIPFMRLKTSWERALARLKVFVEQDAARQGTST